VIEVTQTHPDHCVRAVLASLLELPLDQVPEPDLDGYYGFWARYNRWLRERGWFLYQLMEYPPYPPDLWIAGVPSLSLRGESHVVVMEGDRLRWDPARPQFKRRRRPTKIPFAFKLLPLPPTA
jgi:hypothetical protein